MPPTTVKPKAKKKTFVSKKAKKLAPMERFFNNYSENPHL